MKLFADLHLHSRYSGGTSQRMNIPELMVFARLKGLDVLGTGDALHPSWLRELKRDLEPDPGGLYRPKTGQNIYFIPQAEVATIHQHKNRARRIHHVILMPSLEIAEQLSEMLSRFGDMSSDGRPVLSMHPAELVELAMNLDSKNVIFPAHVWTPWWSIFGARSGVDSMEECYEDQVKHIHAIETGLSSDPPMNWRVSGLHRYTILSFSDSHSPYPYRLGREATVFEVESPTYQNIHDAIVKRTGKNRVELTIEVPPAYGKYHWSGHRKCGVGPIPPEEARRMDYKCPVCGKTLTKGVDDRVEELADKPRGYTPENAQGFIYLLPLQELIALAMGVEPESEAALNSKRVWSIYEQLVSAFGSEFAVLLEAGLEEISKASSTEIAKIIAKLREGKIKLIPGYDGVYGKIVLDEHEVKKVGGGFTKRLEDFL
ncbi:MAG: endonuclease Q family protein [Nitrososphaerota archaeon]